MSSRESATHTREWLFKADGQVFGPIDEDRLLQLVAEGRITGATQVAQGEGAFQPIASLPGFLVHLRKAEARARVEAEVTGARRLERRRAAARMGALAAATFALLAVAGLVAWYLATRRPWERQSSLLADLGDGIAIGPARVGQSKRSVQAQDELALPVVAEPPREPSRHAAPPRRAATAPAPKASANGAIRGGGLVLAQYDPARIQEAVARQRGSLASCLRQEAHRSPEFSGEIPIEFAVGNDGRVAALWIDEPRFKSGALRDCVLEKMRAWVFDAFPGQRPVVSLALRIGR